MFNPEARWDRKFPGEDEIIREKIEVYAFFRKGKVYPRVFIYKGREYRIKKITYYWREKKGEEVLHYFASLVGEDLYYLCFSSHTLSWTLIIPWRE